MEKTLIPVEGKRSGIVFFGVSPEASEEYEKEQEAAYLRSVNKYHKSLWSRTH